MAGPSPKLYTCDGQDWSPALEWANEPRGVESFALIMDDPDAPGGTWTHWLLWDVPAHVYSLPETSGQARWESGKNDFGRPGYGGPCPPKGHGVHRYHFTLYALDRPVLGLPTVCDGARNSIGALKGRVLAQAQYMDGYGRG